MAEPKDGSRPSRIIQHTENVKEQIGTQVIMFMVPGLIMLIAGALMVFVYPGPIFRGLGWVLFVVGGGLTGYGLYSLTKTKKVTEYQLDCPFCGASNVLTDQPDEDVRCLDCKRMIPILDGQILRVSQVRCGYCSHLNYYSEKSTGLICENCDSLIPIATDEEAANASVLELYTLKEDHDPYDLVLLDNGVRTEKLIDCLQHMLALNRNQIKKILEACPATLFTGVPKKKAELLLRDIQLAGGKAEYKVSEQNAPDKR